jgi:hypothetical protein
MNDYIKFAEIPTTDYENLKNILTCFNENQDICQEGTNNCIYENETCKLILPDKNLLSSENNFDIYFFRLSDELIRFPKIREYIMQSNIYLSFEKVKYNLNNSEILLLEEVLLEEYFDNIEMKTFNKYANIKNSYDEIEPNNSVKYDFNFEMLDEMNRNSIEAQNKQNLESNMLTNKKSIDQSLFEKDLYESSIKCINSDFFNRKINLKKYKEFNEINKDRFKIIEFFNTEICSFQLILNIIRLKLNEYINMNDLKQKLSSLIDELYTNKKKQKNIKEIYKLSNKIQIYNYIGKNNFETLVFNEIYYLTEFEFILLALHYNIRLMIISRTELGSINNNVILVDIESDNTVVILLENYKIYNYKIQEENNFIPNMGLLENKNSILIDNDILDINEENIVKITDINDYLKLTFDKFKKIKKEETLYNKESMSKSNKKLKTKNTSTIGGRKRKIILQRY